MKNIYYFQKICQIGGIETFFRNLAEKYKDTDITFYYRTADADQLAYLKQYCRCIRFEPAELKSGEKIKCDKAFFNFNLDMLPYVDAKETILVVHGNYELMGIDPPKNDKIDRVIAVSKDSAEAYTRLTGIPCEVCYNPLLYKKPEKVLKLVCACRLGDPVKGGDRLRAFVRKLDAYCAETGKKYFMTVFTTNGTVNSPNVAVMPPRLDIIPFMNDADYLLQFSDAEGYCYSVVEMLYLCNKPVVITPCPVFDEIGIDDTMSLRLNFDLSNMDDVIDKMFTAKWNFKYKAPKDRWNEIFAEGKSNYVKPDTEVVIVMRYYDIELQTILEKGATQLVTKERATKLVNTGVAKYKERLNVNR